jgi:hypothetical protein
MQLPDPEHEPTPLGEPLLLAALVTECAAGDVSGGAVARIVQGLLDAPVSDADRAGERLRVFGWQGERRSEALVWDYLVLGDESGEEYVRFTLVVRGASSDLPLSLLGLQLQIVLNCVRNASSEELDCYRELAEACRTQLGD